MKGKQRKNQTPIHREKKKKQEGGWRGGWKYGEIYTYKIPSVDEINNKFQRYEELGKYIFFNHRKRKNEIPIY